jgi:nitric oxide reductase activation protein
MNSAAELLTDPQPHQAADRPKLRVLPLRPRPIEGGVSPIVSDKGKKETVTLEDLKRLLSMIERLQVVDEILDNVTYGLIAVSIMHRKLTDERRLAEEEEFRRLADQWHRETDHLSVTLQVLANRAYKKILTFGKVIVPFILEDLKTQGGHWFEALELLTGENPARDANTYHEATEAWLQWGAHRYHPIKRE